MDRTHIALYPGSFDGLTYGHVEIIERGSRLFDRFFVSIAHNENKNPVFSFEERMEMLREETRHLDNIEISHFHGLTVDYAESIGAKTVIRGIRVVSDFEYELQMAQMNRVLNANIETLFMFPSAEQLYISSTLIKEVLLLGGDIRKFVPPTTERLLREKYRDQIEGL